ncbi:MAG TPA: hypothetical protein VGQ83_18060 [Polyangia bacterium]|jgi:hypothetical protein
MVSARGLVLWAALGAVAACTGANPDYDPDAASAICTGGQRRCGAAGPEVCAQQASGGYDWAQDFCPAGGRCDNGHCAAPAGATACVRNADCGAQVCVVFVSGAGLGRFCAPATGSIIGGGACQTSSDCLSGLCQKQATGGALCYTACAEAGDCNGGRTCQQADVTITGVRGTIQGCMK